MPISGKGKYQKHPSWSKLEKVWLEEELSISDLSDRFGIPVGAIVYHLRKKFNTAGGLPRI